MSGESRETTPRGALQGAQRAARVRARTPREGRVRIPQQARSRRTRQRTLEAAARCFEQLGYDETTTAEIARQAGIAVGSVYDYFEDKRAILLEILHGTIDEVADMVIQGLAPESWREADPRESVRRLIHLVFHARTVRPGVQRILWERFFKDPEFRSAMEAVENRLRGAIAELLDILKAEGRIRIDDIPSAAYVIHLSVEWTASRLILGGAEIETSAAVEAASDMISRYLFRIP